jgi:hypothetical protein
MVLNVIVTEGMVPSLNSSRNLALLPNLLFSTKCNAEVALKTGHFRQLGITIRNLKAITDVIVFNIPRWMFLEHCREWYKCEIDFPRHTRAPSCTTAQFVNLGATSSGHLGNLGRAASDRLFYACLVITNAVEVAPTNKKKTIKTMEEKSKVPLKKKGK